MFRGARYRRVEIHDAKVDHDHGNPGHHKRLAAMLAVHDPERRVFGQLAKSHHALDCLRLFHFFRGCTHLVIDTQRALEWRDLPGTDICDRKDHRLHPALFGLRDLASFDRYDVGHYDPVSLTVPLAHRSMYSRRVYAT